MVQGNWDSTGIRTDRAMFNSLQDCSAVVLCRSIRWRGSVGSLGRSSHQELRRRQKSLRTWPTGQKRLDPSRYIYLGAQTTNGQRTDENDVVSLVLADPAWEKEKEDEESCSKRCRRQVNNNQGSPHKRPNDCFANPRWRDLARHQTSCTNHSSSCLSRLPWQDWLCHDKRQTDAQNGFQHDKTDFTT